MGSSSLAKGASLPDALLDAEVSDPAGETRPLRALIGDKPTLLVFVRQFACAGCQQRTAELMLSLDVLAAAGVGVVIVGCGSVQHAKDFAEDHALASRAIELVTDPTRRAHQAAGLERSTWGALGPIATFNLVRAILGGHPNGWGHGDFYQLGGTVLVDAEGRVLVHHQERHIGESLPIGDVVERALALAAKTTPEHARIP